MKKIVRLLHGKIRTGLRRALRALQRTWAAHSDLVGHNAAYEAAMAGAAAALIVQTTLERFLTALVSALLASYVAVRRAARWQPTRNYEDSWTAGTPRSGDLDDVVLRCTEP